MRLQYSAQDADLWGGFSGDFNPIHFDLAEAKKLGMTGLTVHGMRAMLDMKHHMSRALLSTPGDAEGYHFSARLRNGIRCDTPHRLALLAPGNRPGIQSQLNDEESDRCCFSARLADVATLDIAEVVRHGEMAAQQWQSLRERFPQIHHQAGDSSPFWSFLDAVLFRHLVFSPETLRSVRASLCELSASTLAEVFTQIPIVQTHHDVCFSRALLVGMDDALPAKTLEIGTLPAMVLGDAKLGYVIRLGVVGFLDAQRRISTSITLKTLPLKISK